MKCRGCDSEAAPRKGRRGRKPEWCSERCRKRQYEQPCIDCGKPHMGRASHPEQRYCHACAQRRSGEASAERARPRRELAERLWAEGRTYREIAPLIGMRLPTLKSQLTNWRNEGYSFPHRHPGQAAAVRRMFAEGRARPFGKVPA
jgi:hypothetical protein